MKVDENFILPQKNLNAGLLIGNRKLSVRLDWIYKELKESNLLSETVINVCYLIL